MENKETIQIVLDAIQNPSHREPNPRELNDILFEMNFDNFCHYVFKMNLVNNIYDSIVLNE